MASAVERHLARVAVERERILTLLADGPQPLGAVVDASGAAAEEFSRAFASLESEGAIYVTPERMVRQQEAPPPCQTGSDGASRPERGQP